MTALHATLKWAQRKDRIFIEIPLRDLKNEKIDLKADSFNFVGQSDGKKYEFAVEFFKSINVETSKWNKSGFHLSFVLMKVQPNSVYWTRLTKSTVKNQYIQVDWTRWIDQDQQNQQGGKGIDQSLNPANMNNFNDSDSDDEKGNLDDLNKNQEVEQKLQEQQIIQGKQKTE